MIIANDKLKQLIDEQIALFSVMSYEQVTEMCKDCSQIIAERGDLAQYGPKKWTKKSTKEYNDAVQGLINGVAFLSFFPGGVKFQDNHYTGIFKNATKENAGNAQEIGHRT